MMEVYGQIQLIQNAAKKARSEKMYCDLAEIQNNKLKKQNLSLTNELKKIHHKTDFCG